MGLEHARFETYICERVHHVHGGLLSVQPFPPPPAVFPTYMPTYTPVDAHGGCSLRVAPG